LMLTTPAGAVLVAESAMAVPAIEKIMRAMRTMKWDFRIGSFLLSVFLVVVVCCWLFVIDLADYPHL
jgi:hypothetical protein